jgi:hypothetical protein
MVMSKQVTHKLWGWPAERYIAMAAFAVALCSMVVSVAEFRAARFQQRINAQPRLSYTFYFNESGAGWKIYNSGLGAARLRGFRMFVDGEPVRDFAIIGKSLGLPQLTRFHFTIPRVGDRIAAGQESILYWLDPGPAAAALPEQCKRVNIQACYCSLYGDCWLFSYDGKFHSPDGEHRRDDSCSIFSGEEKGPWWGG